MATVDLTGRELAHGGWLPHGVRAGFRKFSKIFSMPSMASAGRARGFDSLPSLGLRLLVLSHAIENPNSYFVTP